MELVFLNRRSERWLFLRRASGKGAIRSRIGEKYNESLVRRGNITFWFDEDVLEVWEHDNAEWKVGRPFTYSDRAIEALLTLRELFRLPIDRPKA